MVEPLDPGLPDHDYSAPSNSKGRRGYRDPDPAHSQVLLLADQELSVPYEQPLLSLGLTLRVLPIAPIHKSYLPPSPSPI